jgi:electron transfer flavoprotein alpha subunit
VVVGVGRGVDPADYGALDALRLALGAELGATRKVTDEGWLPRSRQVGITGRSIAPRLYVSIGASGKFNHVVGVRAAGTVLAINPDPSAPVFDAADVGIVGAWRDAVPLLVEALARATTSAPPGDART